MQQADQTNIITGPWKRRSRRGRPAAPEGGEVALRPIETKQMPDGRWVTTCAIVTNVIPIDGAV
jgi:hypothetical protein